EVARYRAFVAGKRECDDSSGGGTRDIEVGAQPVHVGYAAGCRFSAGRRDRAATVSRRSASGPEGSLQSHTFCDGAAGCAVLPQRHAVGGRGWIVSCGGDRWTSFGA